MLYCLQAAGEGGRNFTGFNWQAANDRLSRRLLEMYYLRKSKHLPGNALQNLPARKH
jgi:hypothetical protein